MLNAPETKNKDVSHPVKSKPQSYWLISVGIAIFIVAALVFLGVMRGRGNLPFSFLSDLSKFKKEHTFEDNFDKKSKAIEETGKMSASPSPDWWVNSGGRMEISGGTGKTIFGDLSPDSAWYQRYKDSNPSDTDDGLHPQNIFRLVMRDQWQNFRQEAYFRINKMNFSASDNRNESNGILLFNRYEDGDNLYYTGLRVDGHAVIKKKYAGKYYTLNEKVFSPGLEYDREKNPNLLPLQEWIGLRSEFRNTPNGDVDIKLYSKVGRGGEWKLAANVIDDGRKDFGTHIIDGAGHAGIRTDFMDVEFSDYKISGI